MPDDTAETFAPGSDHGGSDAPDGRGRALPGVVARPRPRRHWALTEYAFLLRDADGTRARPSTRRIGSGCFARAIWLRLLAAAGFEASVVDERTSEEREPRRLFVAHRLFA